MFSSKRSAFSLNCFPFEEKMKKNSNNVCIYAQKVVSLRKILNINMEMR